MEGEKHINESGPQPEITAFLEEQSQGWVRGFNGWLVLWGETTFSKTCKDIDPTWSKTQLLDAFKATSTWGRMQERASKGTYTWGSCPLVLEVNVFIKQARNEAQFVFTPKRASQ